MPLPASVPTGTVKGRYWNRDGSDSAGEVVFEALTLVDVPDLPEGVVLPTTITVAVTAGVLDKVLAAGIYRATVRLTEYRSTKVIEVTAGGTLSLPDAAPLTELPELYAPVLTVEGFGPDANGNVDLSSSFGVTDHAELTGLTDDDHPQYYNAARLSTALAPYATNAGLASGLATKEDLGVAASLDAAHVAAGDPHPQYALETALADVATSGAYADLTGTPSIPDSPDDIGAQPAGDYATNTALALKVAKGELVFNVKDYGAVGNDITDDSAAIQATLAAANTAGGGTVFFPVGTYKISITAGNALTIPGKGITLLGANREKSVIKLASSQGDYVSMLTNASNDVSGLTIRDLTFNQNASGNVISDITNLMGGQPRYILRCFLGYDITVDNCRFTDADNVNTLSFNATSGVGRVSVRNSLFDAHGGNSPDHDHSTLYFNCDGMIVDNNTFIGVGASARTAIETHGPNQVVTGNVITDFFTGMNLTGVSNYFSRGTTCSDNVITGCGVGIHLWSWSYGGNTTVGYEDVVVHGNTIEVDLDAWASTVSYKAGILFEPSSTLGFKNILVSSNVIRYAAFTTVPTATDLGSAGISFIRSSNYTGVDQDIVIEGNKIENTPTAGMYFNPRSTVRSLHIKRNVVRNPRSGASANINAVYATGVMIQGLSGNGSYTDLQVTDNTFLDDRGTHLLNSGIDSQFVTMSVTNATAARNTLFMWDGASVNLVTPGTIVWSRGVVSESGLFTNNRYYTAPVISRTTLAVVDGTIYAEPFWLGVDRNFDRIGITVATAAASSAVRLGVYRDNGNGSPGALIRDAGTIDSTTTGAKEITLSPVMGLPSGCVWLCAVAQGGAPTLQAGTGPLMPVGGGSLANVIGSGNYAGFIATGVSGALPSTFPAISNYVATVPLLAVRASA